MSFCWLWGHEKKYVGIETIVWKDESGYLEVPCPHDKLFLKNCSTCGNLSQIARWVCSCGVMGEDYIQKKTGLFCVSFGKLVPDEKAWANHQVIKPRE